MSIIAYLMYCVPALLQTADYARATSMASRSMTSQAKIEASLRRGYRHRFSQSRRCCRRRR